MKNLSNKVTKGEMRKELHLTRAPRMEGAVKNAMMDPVRKKKSVHEKAGASKKPQGFTASQRKNYQLPSRTNKH